MREFMDYVHSAFYDASSWNRDNTYAALNATSDGTALPLKMSSFSRC
jgi:distribution and morphology protein 10